MAIVLSRNTSRFCLRQWSSTKSSRCLVFCTSVSYREWLSTLDIQTADNYLYSQDTVEKNELIKQIVSNVIILFSAMHFRLVICIITGHCSAHKQMQLQAQRTVNLRQMPRMSSSCLVQCTSGSSSVSSLDCCGLVLNQTLFNSASDNGLPLNHEGW